MSKTKMLAAKELIQEKRYDEARAILRSVNHPTAVEWLEKLDKLDPPNALQKILRAVLPTPVIKGKPSENAVRPQAAHPNSVDRNPKRPVEVEPAVEQVVVTPKTSNSVHPAQERHSGFSKAVAGEFDGIEFRSQLEIRFAAELKKRDIEYQYEFARIGKGNYMIDFYLPHLGIWVEVKGKMDARDEYMLQECAEVLREERNESIYVYSSDRKMHLVHDGQLEYIWPGKFWDMLEAQQSAK